jgi:GxxExxY protein
MKRIGKTSKKIIFPELSYEVNGLLFKVHNELGRFCKEKQYGDTFESLLKEKGLQYEREKPLPLDRVKVNFTNIADFVINNELLVDLKAKPVVTKEDYSQIQRYLRAGNYKLGLIVNFRNKYLKPIRVIRLGS